MWLTSLVAVGFVSYIIDVYVHLYLCCFHDSCTQIETCVCSLLQKEVM